MDLDKVKRFIRAHDRFLIASHHNPDADAMASCLAMAHILKRFGKKSTVVNEDRVPAWLDFLPGVARVKQASSCKAIAHDAVIILDCGDRARIGGVERLLGQGKPVLNIDHHVTNNSFGAVNVIIPKASSTCEIIYEMASALKVRLDKATAALLYAGIMTDTGSFRYDNTSARVHVIAADLMGFGINAQDMYERLYVGIPVSDMKIFAKVIHEAELLLKGRVYCVRLSAKTNAAFSKAFDLKDKLFGFLRSVEGIEVVVILTELKGNQTRINLRSQGTFNVAKLAMQFNGGGHAKAAGGKIQGSLPQARQEVLAAIARQLKDK